MFWQNNVQQNDKFFFVYIHIQRGLRGRDCMVVGFTITYAISALAAERLRFCSYQCLSPLKL